MGRGGDRYLACCKRNLFVSCCIIAALTMLSYLAAFSCELAWLLESGGDLHVASYLLCVVFLILFVNAFILIHGLVTSTLMEVASWAILIAVLSIPELIFVVHMISEHWGIQSVHGLTELIGYLLRTAINVIGLCLSVALCNRWRSESQMLLTKILIDPATAHQQSINLGHPHIHYQQHPHYAAAAANFNGGYIGGGGGGGGGGSLSKKSFDNFAFNAFECPSLPSQTLVAASKNEFNASAFGLHVEPAGGRIPSSYFGMNPSRSHSMHDLRMIRSAVPAHMYHAIENPMLWQKNHKYDHNMYHTIHFKPKVYNKQQFLKRNCISMENLKMGNMGQGAGAAGGGSNSNSLRKQSANKKSNSNQCINISHPQPMNNNNSGMSSTPYYAMPFGYIYDRIDKKNQSKQSLGTNASSDDCFRYRDVAL